MKSAVVWRKLNKDEADILSEQTRSFSDLGFVNVERWLSFDTLPILMVDRQFAGVLGLYYLSSWIKLGPFVVLQKYQGKGYGRKLFQEVVSKYHDRNIYIGSSHLAVWKLARNSGFWETNDFFSLPREIKEYLVIYFVKRLDLDYIVDGTKKLACYRKREYRYFLKRN